MPGRDPPDGSLRRSGSTSSGPLVICLVEKLTQYPWPTNTADRDALFQRLGRRHEKQFPANTKRAVDVADHFHLETRGDGPPIFATSREIDVLIESIHWQLRLDSAPPDLDATQCFDAILSSLADLHGEPTLPWHGQRGLWKMWKLTRATTEPVWNPPSPPTSLVSE